MLLPGNKVGEIVKDQCLNSSFSPAFSYKYVCLSLIFSKGSVHGKFDTDYRHRLVGCRHDPVDISERIDCFLYY